MFKLMTRIPLAALIAVACITATTIVFAGTKIDEWLHEKYVVKHQDEHGHTHDFTDEIYRPGKRDNTFTKKKEWYKLVHEVEHFVFQGGSDNPVETHNYWHTHWHATEKNSAGKKIPISRRHKHSERADPDTAGVITKSVQTWVNGQSYDVTRVNWKYERKRIHDRLMDGNPTTGTHFDVSLLDGASGDSPSMTKAGNNPGDGASQYEMVIDGKMYVVTRITDDTKWHTGEISSGKTHLLKYDYTLKGETSNNEVDEDDFAIWLKWHEHNH